MVRVFTNTGLYIMSELGPHPANAWRLKDGVMDLSRQQPAPNVVEFHAENYPVRIDLSRTALIVIDMQRLFCEPDDGRASRNAIAPLGALLPALREANVPIIWVNWGNRPDEANLPPGVRYPFNRRRLDAPAPFLTAGSTDAQTVPELPARAGDIHVDKYRLSGFWDTPLDSILRGRRIDTLLFSGVNLDQCVYHTLADAHFLGYDCVLLRDCAATVSPDFCIDATLYNVKGMGFVAESSALRAALSDGR
ncbi:MAG: cysteine hydrolase [Pseudomonadales bacterium]|nr:cysteine hydrolase [Pseudomonadales bacterium]